MAFNTIVIKSYLDIRDEHIAAASITPGMLIERVTAGTVQAHASDGGSARRVWAIEDGMQGNGIDDDYAADDPVQCWSTVNGEEIYALLEAGEVAVIGSKLVSAGNGYLKVFTGESLGPEAIVAEAQEAVSAAASSTATADRILVKSC